MIDILKTSSTWVILKGNKTNQSIRNNMRAERDISLQKLNKASLHPLPIPSIIELMTVYLACCNRLISLRFLSIS